MTSAPALPAKSLEGFIKAGNMQPATAKPPLHRRIAGQQAASADKVHSKRQHTNTLMRSSVTKPHSHRPSSFAGRLQSSPEIISKDKDMYNIHSHLKASRRRQAKKVPKSSFVKRFNWDQRGVPIVVKKTAALEVKSSPDQTTGHHYEPAIAEHPASQEPNDLFADVLGRATSHQQAAPKPAKRRHKVAKKLGLSRKAANIGAITLIVIVLGGFIAYQNLPNIAMHMAVAKAGVHAMLPGYQPSGFALNRHIQARPGQVVISFKSNSDDRNFKITQSASDWNSQTLLDNYVAASGQPYQRINQNNGKTVFIYGSANASWVDGGVWYKVEGNSSLTNDQLLKIANSF